MSRTQSILFKNYIPEIRKTDAIDVYDLVFNLQMPEKVPKPTINSKTDDDKFLDLVSHGVPRPTLCSMFWVE